MGLALYLSGQSKLNNYWCSLEPSSMAFHHFALGLVFIISGIFVYGLSAKAGSSQTHTTVKSPRVASAFYSWQLHLSINLGVTSSITLLFSHQIYSLTPYAYLTFDYPTLISIFCHHSWISFGLILGSVAHASNYVLYEMHGGSQAKGELYNLFYSSLIHREIILG